MKQSKCCLMMLVLLAFSGMASAAEWNMTRWQSVYKDVPPPPASLEAAGKMVGHVLDSYDQPVLGLVDKPLMQSVDARLAGVAALNQLVLTNVEQGANGKALKQGTGLDVARLQSDPAYRQAMQDKMENMSDADKMQMAMQMSSAFQSQNQAAAIVNDKSGMSLSAYLAKTDRQVGSPSQVGKDINELTEKFDSQHKALDKILADALMKCPPVRGCVGECQPDPGCVAQINARVPKLIADHRKLAKEELAAMTQLYKTMIAAEQPVLAKVAQLTKTAEAAGSDDVSQGYNRFSIKTGTLQVLVATASLRAGYWANVRRIVIPDEYRFKCPGYSYPPEGNDFMECTIPDSLPKGWGEPKETE